MFRHLPDRKFFVAVLLIALVFALLPTIFGRVITPPGKMFIGNVPFAPADFSVYYGYINEGRAGYLFMYDVFTSEAHTATLIQPLWLILGLLARLSNLATPTIFVIGRLLAIVVLLRSLWWAAVWLWPNDQLRRRLGLLLSIFSGGIGGLIVWITNPTLSGNVFQYPDLWVTEMYPWLSLWGSPHFLLVTAGIVFVLVAVERSWAEQRWRLTLWASLVALAVVSIHPFHVITWFLLWVGMTTFHLIRFQRIPWGYITRWVTVLGVAGPIVLLYGLQLLTDPITIGRAVQNVNLSDPWWKLLIGLGVPLLAAIVSWRWLRWRDSRWAFVGLLVVAYAVAMYLPISFQRRLSHGLMIPIAWLATESLYRWWRWSWPRRWWRVAVLSTGVVLVSSSLVVLMVIAKTYLHDIRYVFPTYYLTTDEQQAAKFLASTDPHQPVLNTIYEANMLGGLSAHQMFIGYSAETLNFDRKEADLKAFYGTMSITEQRQMLSAYHLCYVFDSVRSRLYGSAFQPLTWPDLQPVFQTSTLTIYRTPYCR